jgi:drug/metabolite transporter (DMT)-like permease
LRLRAALLRKKSQVPLARENRRGIVAILAATATFSANDSIVKFIAREYPVGEVLFLRGVMTTVMVGAVLLAWGHAGALRSGLNGLVCARSILEAVAALLFTSAVIHMPLASLSTILLASPLIITALSVIVFKELVGWRRWTAIAVGFVGTLFVVKPTPDAFNVWALLGLVCAFISASRDTITRRLDTGIPTIVISFMSAVSVMIAGWLLGLGEAWPHLPVEKLTLLGVAAVFLAAGNFFVVLAFRGVDVSLVAPFRYSALLWAGLAGYLVFGEIPDRWSLLGAALIVGSGVYALHREAVRGRELTSRASPGR